ncbi:MAG: hypothetical protein JXQ71_13540 [Verrucomicrobia bacterium]|nr:hypothetical protein [Verrucomicrobiota bacterium]
MTANAVLMVVVVVLTAAFTSFFLWKANQRDKERDRLARERDRDAYRVHASSRPQKAA